MVRSTTILAVFAAASGKDLETERSCLLQQTLQSSGRVAREADDGLAIDQADGMLKAQNQPATTELLQMQSNVISQSSFENQQPTEEEAKAVLAFAAEERMRELQQGEILEAQKKEAALIDLQRQMQLDEDATPLAKTPEKSIPRVDQVSAMGSPSAPQASLAMAEATQRSLQSAELFPKLPPVMLQQEATLTSYPDNSQRPADQAGNAQAALVSMAPALSAEAHSCQPGGGAWPACAATAAYGPEHSSCTPQCTWQCETPKCDEVCEPTCEPPRCETRCAAADLSNCVMECDEPHCAVTCNRNQCPSGGCPSCVSSCSEPMCKLRCPSAQPCRNVCEVPRCEWHCHAPELCPEPTCHMVCESPPNCHGDTYQQLPPLSPGEMSVRSFAAPPLGEGIGGSAQQFAPTVTGSSPANVVRAPEQFAPMSYPLADSTPFVDASSIPPPAFAGGASGSPPISRVGPEQFARASYPLTDPQPMVETAASLSLPNDAQAFGTGFASPDRWDEYMDRFTPHHDPEYGLNPAADAESGSREGLAELAAEAGMAPAQLQAAEDLEASLLRAPGSFSQALRADPDIAAALQTSPSAGFSQPSLVRVETEAHSPSSTDGSSLDRSAISLPVLPTLPRPL